MSISWSNSLKLVMSASNFSLKNAKKVSEKETVTLLLSVLRASQLGLALSSNDQSGFSVICIRRLYNLNVVNDVCMYIIFIISQLPGIFSACNLFYYFLTFSFVRFLGNLVLHLWDCGGEQAYRESYFIRECLFTLAISKSYLTGL